MRLIFCALALTISTVLASPAFAYIGPGLGAGTLAVIFGFIISIFWQFLRYFGILLSEY